MKKLIVLCISYLFCITAKTQNYTPFNFEKGIWINTDAFSAADGFSQSYQYFSDGDTLINSLTYFKLYQYGFYQPVIGPLIKYPVSYYCAIRNNNNKQVMYIQSGDTFEKKLYDFNLKIGDTILNGKKENGLNPIVKSIDSVLICKRYYKRYKTQYFNCSINDSTSLIEGIGMNQILFGAGSLTNCNEAISTGCYTESKNDSCVACNLLLDLKKIPDILDQTKIFPNPVNSMLFVKSLKIINTLFITDLSGRLVFSTDIKSTNANINLLTLDFGYYVIKIMYQDKSSIYKTFIKF
jgi:hypothetical protein